MNDMKIEISKERFSPIIKETERDKIQTQIKDECWNIDMIKHP